MRRATDHRIIHVDCIELILGLDPIVPAQPLALHTSIRSSKLMAASQRELDEQAHEDGHDSSATKDTRPQLL